MGTRDTQAVRRPVISQAGLKTRIRSSRVGWGLLGKMAIQTSGCRDEGGRAGDFGFPVQTRVPQISFLDCRRFWSSRQSWRSCFHAGHTVGKSTQGAMTVDALDQRGDLLACQVLFVRETVSVVSLSLLRRHDCAMLIMSCRCWVRGGWVEWGVSASLSSCECSNENGRPTRESAWWNPPADLYPVSNLVK